MAEFNSNNTATGGENNQQGEKTFTQDELNNIIGERLAKEKVKNEALLVQKEKELAERELRLTASEKLVEKGLPIELLEALNCTSSETLENSIKIIETAIKKNQRHDAVITGAKPGDSSTRPQKPGGDQAIRDAMGLR